MCNVPEIRDKTPNPSSEEFDTDKEHSEIDSDSSSDMRQILFFIFIAICFARKTTPEESCAACHFAARLFKASGKHIEPVQRHGVFTVTLPDVSCSNIQNCAEEMSDCEIVRTLENLVHTPASSEGALAVQKHYQMAKIACGNDPAASLLAASDASDPSTTTCLLCFLLRDVMLFINNSIVGGALESEIEGLLDTLFGNSPIPLIVPLIFQGLRDSMGAIYQAIGVVGLHCPVDDNDFGAKCHMQ